MNDAKTTNPTGSERASSLWLRVSAPPEARCSPPGGAPGSAPRPTHGPCCSAGAAKTTHSSFKTQTKVLGHCAPGQNTSVMGSGRSAILDRPVENFANLFPNRTVQGSKSGAGTFANTVMTLVSSFVWLAKTEKSPDFSAMSKVASEATAKAKTSAMTSAANPGVVFAAKGQGFQSWTRCSDRPFATTLDQSSVYHELRAHNPQIRTNEELVSYHIWT